MYIRNKQPIPCKSSLYTTAKTTVFLALTHKPTHISGTARVLAAVRQRVNGTRHVLHHHSCPWPFLPARRTPTRVDRVSGTKSHQDDSPSRRPSRSAPATRQQRRAVQRWLMVSGHVNPNPTPTACAMAAYCAQHPQLRYCARTWLAGVEGDRPAASPSVLVLIVPPSMMNHGIISSPPSRICAPQGGENRLSVDQRHACSAGASTGECPSFLETFPANSAHDQLPRQSQNARPSSPTPVQWRAGIRSRRAVQVRETPDPRCAMSTVRSAFRRTESPTPSWHFERFHNPLYQLTRNHPSQSTKKREPNQKNKN